MGRWLLLGVAAAMPVAVAAPSAAQTPRFELRGEGSFPLQYIETKTATSDSRITNAIPYLGLMGTAHFESDLRASVFANGGHGQLGSFLDNDNTFASMGSSIAKRWGAFTAGLSVEHTHYFDGTFGPETSVANDTNLFASYVFTPNRGLRISPSAIVSVRADDLITVQRYTASARIDIAQQLSGPWWFLASARFRHLDYVNRESGRHDARLAIVTGLKYVMNESMSVRALTGWEKRDSNVASRKAEKFSIGASFDVDIDFASPRGPR